MTKFVTFSHLGKVVHIDIYRIFYTLQCFGTDVAVFIKELVNQAAVLYNKHLVLGG